MNYIRSEVKDNVNVLTIKTENPLNPLNIEILREIGSEVTKSDKVVLIKGEGKAFSAGADIRNFTKMSPKDAHHFASEGHDIMNSIAAAEVPVIAAIHGYALGGGFELALACDFRISTPDAKMGLPEITLGILPGFGGTQRLTALIGESRALEMISTGMRIRGTEAMAMGIVNRIGEDHLAEAMELARNLADKPPLALKHVKSLIRSRPDDRYSQEMEKFGILFNSEDSREGFDAFLNKRKPRFTGK